MKRGCLVKKWGSPFWRDYYDHEQDYAQYAQTYEGGSVPFAELHGSVAEANARIVELEQEIRRIEGRELSDETFAYLSAEAQKALEEKQASQLAALREELKAVKAQVESENREYSYYWSRVISDMQTGGKAASEGSAQTEQALRGSNAELWKYYHNISEFLKESENTDYVSGDINLTFLSDNRIEFMTADECRIFLYCCNIGNLEAAEAYLQDIQPTLTARKGAKQGEKYDIPVIREAIALFRSAAQGVENIGYGIGSLFTDMDAPELTAGDYMMQYWQEANKGSLAYYTTAAAANIGNQLPTVMAYAFNPMLGKATTFLNTRGSAYVEAKRNGASHAEAWTYSTLVGASEAGLEALLGAAGGRIKGVLPQRLTKWLGNIGATSSKLAPRLLKDFAVSNISEIIEENTQNYLEPAFAMLAGMTDRYDAPGMEDFLETTIVTVLSSSAFYASNLPQKTRQLKYNDAARAWAEQAVKMGEESELSELAGYGKEIMDMLDEGQDISPEYMNALFAQFGDLQQTQSTADKNNAQGTRMIDLQDDSEFTMLAYDDTQTQEALAQETHTRMVQAGQIVQIQSKDEVAAHYPDLRGIKKTDRNAILKNSIAELKGKIRSFLTGLKSNQYQFSVNGNVLEARIYDKGIREVTSKLTQDKANMLYQTEEIFQNAQYLYSTPDYDGNPDIYRWNYFYTPVQIGEETIGVRIAIRDMAEANQSQIYHWGIKKDPSLDVAKRRNTPNPGGVSFDESNDSIAQTEQGVKGDAAETLRRAEAVQQANPNTTVLRSPTVQKYLDTGKVTLGNAQRASAVLDEIVSGRKTDVSDSEIDCLMLTSNAGVKVASEVLGVEIPQIREKYAARTNFKEVLRQHAANRVQEAQALPVQQEEQKRDEFPAAEEITAERNVAPVSTTPNAMSTERTESLQDIPFEEATYNEAEVNSFDSDAATEQDTDGLMGYSEFKEDYLRTHKKAGTNEIAAAYQSYQTNPVGLGRNAYYEQVDADTRTAVDALGKLFGFDIRFDDLGSDNGYYVVGTNKVVIDIDPSKRGAVNPFLFTASHELGHAIRDRLGEQAWAEFEAYAVKAMGGESAVKDKQNQNDSYSDAKIAREDVACDFLGKLLSDKATLNAFCASVRNGAFDAEHAKGVAGLIRRIVQKIRASKQFSSTIKKQFGEDIENARKAADAILQAAENAVKVKENTTDEGSVTKYAKKAKAETKAIQSSGEADSIKAQIAAASDKLNRLDPVATIMAPFEGGSKIDEALLWTRKHLTVTEVDRKGYGKVSLADKWLKEGLGYTAKNVDEIAAILAVPSVIKRGIEIGHNSNHKGRGFSTTTFGAPVEINGVRGNMGVVVKETKPWHYHAHRILLPDGTVFAIPETEDAEPSTAVGHPPKENDFDTPISSASENSITESNQKSNPPKVKKSVKTDADIAKRDADYMAAVKSGDMDTAQRLVNQAAERAGYSNSEDWRMDHRAPNSKDDTGHSMDQINRAYGQDDSIYSPQAVYYYGEGRSYDRKAINVIRMARSNPEKLVTIYRAVPTHIQDTRVRNGDWVAITKECAQEHGERMFDEDYRIIENKVPAKHLYGNGDSIHEWGYDNGNSDEVYKNTVGNVKLAAVTYDDDGNVIPLSERFNEKKTDIRYSKKNTIDYSSLTRVAPIVYIGNTRGGKGKYWRPNLSKKQWGILDLNIAKDRYSKRNWINDTDKWLYANDTNETIFAVYSLSDFSHPTVLYAVAGPKSERVRDRFLEMLEEDFDNDGSRESIVQAIKNLIRRKKSGAIRNHSNGHRRTTNSNDGVSHETHGRRNSSVLGDGRGSHRKGEGTESGNDLDVNSGAKKLSKKDPGIKSYEEAYGTEIQTQTQLDRAKARSEERAELQRMYSKAGDAAQEARTKLTQLHAEEQTAKRKQWEQDIFTPPKTLSQRDFFTLSRSELAERHAEVQKKLVQAEKDKRGEIFLKQKAQAQLKRTKGVQVDPNGVYSFVRELMKQHESPSLSNESVREKTDALLEIFNHTAQISDTLDLDSAFVSLWYATDEWASAIINEGMTYSAGSKQDTLYEQYSDLRSYLRNTTISLPQSQKNDVSANFSEWRNGYMGRLNVKLVEDGRGDIDTVYSELAGQYPNFFRDQMLSEADMLLHIADVIDSIYDSKAADVSYAEKYGEAERQLMVDMMRGRILEEFVRVNQNPRVQTVMDRVLAKAKKQLAEQKRDLQKAHAKALAQATEKSKLVQNVKDTQELLRYAERSGREAARISREYEQKIEQERKRAERLEHKAAMEAGLREREKAEKAFHAQKRLAEKRIAELEKQRDAAIYRLRQAMLRKGDIAAIRAWRKYAGEPGLSDSEIATQIKDARVISQDSRKKNRFSDRVKDTARTLNTELISDVAPLEAFSGLQTRVDNVDTKITYYRNSPSVVNAIYREHLIDRNGNILDERSLADIALCYVPGTKKVDTEAQALLNDYIYHKHAYDRMTIELRAAQRMDAFIKAHPEYDSFSQWSMDHKHGMTISRIIEAAASGDLVAQEYIGLAKDFREAKNKAVFGDDSGKPVSAATSKTIYEDIEKNAPWVVEKANEYYRWWDLFMQQWWVGTFGTESDYKKMKQLYPHYVPTYRINSKKKGSGRSKGINITDPIQAATGSTLDLRTFEDNLAKRVSEVVEAERMNEIFENVYHEVAVGGSEAAKFSEFATAFFDAKSIDYNAYTELDPDIASDSGQANAKRFTETDDGVIWKGFIHGTQQELMISQEIFHSLKALSGDMGTGKATDALKIFMKTGRIASSVLKNAATGFSLTFPFTNLSSDVQSAIIYGGFRMIPKMFVSVTKITGHTIGRICQSFANVLSRRFSKSDAKIVTSVMNFAQRRLEKNERWQLFKDLGGKRSARINENDGFIYSFKGKNLVSGSKETIVSVLSAAGEFAESITRFAAFDLALDRFGDTPEGRAAAIKSAAEITVDFARHGGIVAQASNAWTPYQNASVQSTAKFFREIKNRKGWEKVHLLKRGAIVGLVPRLLVALAAICLLSDEDEEAYRDLTQRQADAYYNISIGDGKFLEIKAERQYTQILGNVAERILLWATDDDPNSKLGDYFSDYLDTSIKANFVPNLPVMDSVIIGTCIDIWRNEDFAGRAIVPSKYQGMAPEDQYDDKTSKGAIWLGETFGVSPLVVDYWIKDNLATYGDMFIEATDSIESSGALDTLWGAFSSGFVVDSAYSSQTVSDYYDMVNDLEATVKGEKAHLSDEEIETSMNIKTLSAIDANFGAEISELNKLVRESSDEDEKRAYKFQIKDIAKKALDFYERCMSGEIEDPVRYLEYAPYGDAIRDELTRLKDYEGGDFTFTPNTTAPKVGDHINTEAQKETFENIYIDHYSVEVGNLISSAKYQAASDEKKLDMLVGARELAYFYAKRDWATEWNISSETYDPTTATNKYDTLIQSGCDFMSAYEIDSFKASVDADEAMSASEKKANLVQYIGQMDNLSDDSRGAAYAFALEPSVPDIGEYKPTAAQKAAYKECYSTYANKVYADILSDPAFQNADDETKADMLSEASGLVSFYSKRQWATDYSLKTDSYDPQTAENKYATMLRGGMSFSEAYAISDGISNLKPLGDNKNPTSLQKWSEIVSDRELDDTEVDAALRAYMNKDEEAVYDACHSAGVTPRQYVSVCQRVDSLSPIGDRESIGLGQKLKACVDTVNTQAAQDALLRKYLDEDTEEKYNTCRKAGVTPRQYADFRMAQLTVADGTWSKSELRSWFRSRSDLTDKEKHVLWAAANREWGEKDPYGWK